MATDLSAMLQPMTQDERSWKAAFTGEFQLIAYLLHSLRNNSGETGVFTPESQYWDRAFLLILFKPNNTINLQYRWFASIQGLLNSPADSLVENTHQLTDEFHQLTDPYRADMVYNPAGKILVAIGAVSPEGYARYVARGHNLDASMRLLRLQMDIYSKRVREKDIEAYLEKTPSDLRDPYHNKPFHWDPSKRELWFEGIDAKSKDTTTLGNKRVGVRIR
jgi:hypothetical protein